MQTNDWCYIVTATCNTWNHLTVCKQMINSKWKYLCSIEILETLKRINSGSFKNVFTKWLNQSHIFNTYVKTGFGI